MVATVALKIHVQCVLATRGQSLPGLVRDEMLPERTQDNEVAVAMQYL